MKRYFAALLLLVPILLTGCYDKWDQSDCPVDDNFELRFSLLAEGGGDLFAGRITKIDVVLFDEGGHFVLHREITQNQLGPNNSIRLTVPPGTYYVVALGNIGSYSTTSPLATGATFNGSYVEVTSAETGGPHYYAPAQDEMTRALDSGMDHSDYKVVLPPGKTVEKTLNFVRIHRTVNMYFRGLDNLADYTGGQVSVEMKNIPYKYDFYRRTDAGRKNYTRSTETVTTNSVQMLKTSFSAPICSFADDMTIHIRNGADDVQLFDDVCLKTWVEENVPAYLNEFDMLFSAENDGPGSVKVTITIPDWEKIGVKPGDL